MKLIVLGSGVAASHFVLGATLRFPPAYVVECGGGRLLLECSELVRTRLEHVGIDYSSIRHIALSHSHPDHCALVHYVQSIHCREIWGGAAFHNQELHVYCPAHIENHFSDAWDFYLPERDGAPFSTPKVIFHSMSNVDNRLKDIGFCTISSLPVFHAHGKCDSLAMRIESEGKRLSYSGDCAFDERLADFIAGSSLFLCECSASPGSEQNALAYGHLTPFQAGVLAYKGSVSTLILTHCTWRNSHQDVIDDCLKSGFTGQLIIAEDFAEYSV